MAKLETNRENVARSENHATREKEGGNDIAEIYSFRNDEGGRPRCSIHRSSFER